MHKVHKEKNNLCIVFFVKSLCILRAFVGNASMGKIHPQGVVYCYAALLISIIFSQDWKARN